MPERFQKIFELPSKLYSPQSPIILTAGVLLKDTKTNSMVVQLKFQSVTNHVIKAVKVKLNAFDMLNNLIEKDIEYSFLNLEILNGQYFGDNKAILLHHDAICTFEIHSISVMGSSGDISQVHFPLTPLKVGTPIEDGLGSFDLVQQYRLTIQSSTFVVPTEYEDLWLCTCGEWNRFNHCTECNADRNVIFSAYSIPNLKAAFEKQLTCKQSREVKRKGCHKSQNNETSLCIDNSHATPKKKLSVFLSSVIVVIFLVAIVLTFVFWLYPNIIIPNITYKQAEEAFSEKEYITARDMFIALGSYKDSSEKVLEIENTIQEENYIHADSLFMEGQFDKALVLFEELGTYKDSNNKIKNIAEVKEVVDSINAIGEVKLRYKSKVEFARTLYNNLSDSLTEYVFNYDILVNAENIIEKIIIEDCELKIDNAISTKYVSDVKAAVANYNNLTLEQQTKVKNAHLLELLPSINEEIENKASVSHQTTSTSQINTPTQNTPTKESIEYVDSLLSEQIIVDGSVEQIIMYESEDSSEYEKYYEYNITIKNKSKYTMSYWGCHFELYDKNGKFIESHYLGPVQNFKPSDKATFNFTSEKRKGVDFEWHNKYGVDYEVVW